jgi:hypothetical protein
MHPVSVSRFHRVFEAALAAIPLPDVRRALPPVDLRPFGASFWRPPQLDLAYVTFGPTRAIEMVFSAEAVEAMPDAVLIVLCGYEVAKLAAEDKTDEAVTALARSWGFDRERLTAWATESPEGVALVERLVERLGITATLGYGLVVGHTDVGHGDSHADSPHGDVLHSDTHTDEHSDLTHGDSEHSDSHGDVVHLDSHTDTHGDVAHSDRAHTDTHSDVAHVDTHTDVAHGDTHADREEEGIPHTDAHGDLPHTDTHGDTLHADSHGDISHLDSHTDTHGDVAHQDVLHVDSHADQGHSDQAHVDTHEDEAHADVSHADTAHADSHLDVSHGDANVWWWIALTGPLLHHLARVIGGGLV